MIAKSRLIKQAPLNNLRARHGTVTYKERQLGRSIEWIDRMEGFRKLWESKFWIPKPYEMPSDGVVPALAIFDPTEGAFIQVGPRIITELY